jgi:hypothetical protein
MPELRQVARPADRSPRLTVLLPALQADRLTGGPNTALDLGTRVMREGIRLRFVSAVEPADADLTRVRAQIAKLAGPPGRADDVELIDATTTGLPIEPDEVLLATWWPTAYIAQASLALTRAPEFIYLIQDFEPAFSAWSTNYALAEATYRFPHRAIFNEGTLEAFFQRRDRGGRGASITFEPAVDRGRFHPPGPGERLRPGERLGPGERLEPGQPIRRHHLLFYARPQADRNAFPLGLRALRLAASRGALPSA